MVFSEEDGGFLGRLRELIPYMMPCLVLRLKVSVPLLKASSNIKLYFTEMDTSLDDFSL
jgi:hypothetical protein